MATKITVVIDPDLEELIPGFLANRRNDIDRIRNHVGAGAMDPIQLLGHSMKGAGGGYGFDAISEFGNRIEIAAKDGNHAAVLAAVADLEDYLNRVHVVMGS